MVGSDVGVRTPRGPYATARVWPSDPSGELNYKDVNLRLDLSGQGDREMQPKNETRTIDYRDGRIVALYAVSVAVSGSSDAAGNCRRPASRQKKYTDDCASSGVDREAGVPVQTLP